MFKIIFAGSPKFAVPFLEALDNQPEFRLTAVLTQPTRPAGRGKKPTASPVKLFAEKKNLQIFQPENLLAPDFLATFGKNKPDLLVTVAFGRLLPPELLAIFKQGGLNLHPSLLPKYRGASPIPAAILAGDEETGLTIIKMDQKLDHGPIIAQKKIKISPTETSRSLREKMIAQGREFWTETISRYLAGKTSPTAQNDRQASFCRALKKSDGKIDWNKSAEKISRKIRAYHPWPNAWTVWNDQRLKIFPPVKLLNQSAEPGTVFLNQNNMAVAAGRNALEIIELQPAGKRKMTSREFLAGHREIIQSRLN